MSKPSGKSKPSSVVISHRKDADGIGSAAVLRFMTGAEVYLTDYGDMAETLSTVKPAEQVFICDLGLNRNTFDAFFDQVRRLSEFGKVHYIDHHPLDPEFASKLKEVGVELFHSTEECASVLIFKKYEEQLKDFPNIKILACCGAITDYLDSQPLAKRLIASFDRQFLLYEATVLSFTIAVTGRGTTDSNTSLVQLAKLLADGKLPHEIEKSSAFAQEYASRSARLIERVKTEGKRMKNYAYFLTKEASTGNVANFLVGAFNVPVGAALREEERGYYEISLRSTDESKHNLGKIVGRIAVKLNTSGGGHPHASGARIKQSQLGEFLSLLDEALSQPP